MFTIKWFWEGVARAQYIWESLDRHGADSDLFGSVLISRSVLAAAFREHHDLFHVKP